MKKVGSLPPVIGGRYRPIDLLGEGGMGSVYVVEHVHTGERLALKMMHGDVGRTPSNVERFKREARASAMIRSEHVVKVIDADVAHELPDAPPFLVMELLDGVDLGRATAAAVPPRALVCEWLTQVARGLDKAHALGLVHRDLKPENLFVSRREDGTALVKILDFGLVKGTSDLESFTITGQVMGSPLFMAPEQAKGETITPATDRWAIGMIAFQLLNGRPYWTANNVSHLLARIVYEKVAPPSAVGCDLGSAFDAWFLRSCSPDPARRWATTAAQVEALGQALGVDAAARAQAARSSFVQHALSAAGAFAGDEGPTLRAMAPDARPRRPSLTTPRVLALAAGALLAVAALAGAVALARSGDPPTAASQESEPAASPPPPPASAAPALAASSAPAPTPSASAPLAAPPAATAPAATALPPATGKAATTRPAPRLAPASTRALDDQY